MNNTKLFLDLVICYCELMSLCKQLINDFYLPRLQNMFDHASTAWGTFFKELVWVPPSSLKNLGFIFIIFMYSKKIFIVFIFCNVKLDLHRKRFVLLCE